MAGHSKWANIRFRKAAQDARRGKMFTKLIREITVSARHGGGDVTANPRLRAAVDKALTNNMSRDTIDRAIQRGTGELEGVEYSEVRYEGYAPGGVAVLVECATDNRNRTVSEVRHAFSKHGGNLGTDGSVAYLFRRCGSLEFPPGCDEERIMEIAISGGADDVVTDESGYTEVITVPEAFDQVRESFASANLEPESAGLVYRPATETPLAGEDAEKVMRLLEALEDLDDVQEVFTNANFPEEEELARTG